MPKLLRRQGQKPRNSTRANNTFKHQIVYLNMKKLLTLLFLCAITISVSAQTNDYKPCDECFGYSSTPQYNTNGYNNVNTTAEQQYNQTCANGLAYENQYRYPYGRPRNEFGNRILRVAIGLISFAIIVAILPRHDSPYIQ